ncbi:MAG TPA: CDP-glycerol glycerophosphotransferase family protein [Gaiella sp.]
MTGPSQRRPWLVLSDPFPTRVFVDCGIVSGVAQRLHGNVELVLVLPEAEAEAWGRRLAGIPARDPGLLFPAHPGHVDRISRRLDRLVDANLGYYPLAVRHSMREGFYRERMQPGHPNLFLDTRQARRLPRVRAVERALFRWHFSRRRYLPHALVEAMREECSGIVAANVQSLLAVPFLRAAQRLDLPVVGYVSSWDHTVGKGIVSPHVTRYVVQNEVMRDDLVRHHGVPVERVVVTGWPQTDVFHEARPRAAYEAVLVDLGLDASHPVVLVAGNTPTNAPYEQHLVERLVAWWREAGAGRFSLLFRPHPRDREWRERFGAALDVEGIAVQEPSYTDLETLATLLQHVDCVVANAGTILLDAIVNDRPAVCVLYDEGAPAGERWAELNVTGAHYRELVESSAFHRARSFGDVAAGIERALAAPAELSAERARVARDVVGEVDGRAAERVVDAIVEIVG